MFKLSLSITILLVLLTTKNQATLAQIKPDLTLDRENSVVEQKRFGDGQKRKLIRGGAERGTNLFHSFKEFNIGVGESVYFAQPTTIKNIFTRVTGGKISQIFGNLGVLGNANLYFVNPSGIVFGKNATLDIKGSFLATTADKILFTDGREFNAVNPGNPILTINVPIGLGFTSKSGDIKVEGTGHNLNFYNFFPTDNPISNNGLISQPGNTLALVGGNIIFDGGVVKAPNGHIELGSVSSGIVTFDLTNSQWQFNYEQVQKFQNITFKSLSLADVSGSNPGEISVQGNQLLITKASNLFIQNLENGKDGSIKVNVSKLIVSGGLVRDELILPGSPNALELASQGIIITEAITVPTFTPSSIAIENLSKKHGSNINITASQIIVDSGAQIGSKGFSGIGGTINIKSENIQVIGSTGDLGFSKRNIDLPSRIGSSVLFEGSGGNVNISAKNILIKNGANMGSLTLGTGASGDIELKVSNSIKIIGASPFSLAASSLTSTSLSEGNSGKISLFTGKLILQKGGSVFTSAFAEGNAGQVNINASTIKLQGVDLTGTYASQIRSSVYSPLSNFKSFFVLPETPTGNSGDVTINSRNLRISERAVISVQNQGTGNAGSLSINSDNISLSTQGSVNAATLFGQGGNIQIKSKNLLINNGEITATAGDLGNGGNINIDTDILVGLNNSSIVANAFQGNGGNIQIQTAGLFISDTTLIQASSRLGIDGQVQINVLRTDLENSLYELSSNFIPTDTVIASSCLKNRNKKQGSFTYTGNGGFPVTSTSEISNFSPLSSPSIPTNATFQPKQSVEYTPENVDIPRKIIYSWKDGDPIIEGNQIIKTSDGRILLVHIEENVEGADSLICE